MPIVTAGRHTRLERGGRPVCRQGRDGAAARQVRGETTNCCLACRYQAQIRAVSRSSTRPAGSTSKRFARLLATRAGSWKTIVVLNFSQQPHRLFRRPNAGTRSGGGGAARAAAEAGRNLVVVTDDAYFGLFYGEDVVSASRCSPSWPAAMNASWPSRSMARRRSNSFGDSARDVDVRLARVSQRRRPLSGVGGRRRPGPSAARSRTVRTWRSRS